MNVYERVEKMRKERGISSQGKLEKELGFSNGSISKWKNSAPTSKRLQKLAAYFGVSVEYLLNGEESDDELEPAAPSQDPLRDYYDRLIRYLDSSPAHRQLISDAAHVRAEDIDLARQFLMRLADPGSSAPELPTLDTSANFQALPSSNHGQTADPQEAPEKILRNARNSCDCADAHVELTDEALALVRDTPEVLKAEAEYIKKMSVKPRRKGATASPSTDAEGRKSG